MYMSSKNCFQNEKQNQTLRKIAVCNHVFQNRKYVNQQSCLIVFCKIHKKMHTTTFINYNRCKNGLSLSGNQKKVVSTAPLLYVLFAC